MKKMLRGAVFSVVLTASAVLWGKEVPRQSVAFPATTTANLKCQIKQTKFGLWNLRVQAWDRAKRMVFDYLYSIHDNINDSMKDCSTWMKAAKKEQIKKLQTKR